MKNVLFVVQQPPTPAEIRRFFETADEKLKPHQKHVARISQTVWLVDNQAAPAALAWLIAMAETCHAAYARAAFESAPEWHTAGFDPRGSEL
jgi:hypothetical protein